MLGIGDNEPDESREKDAGQDHQYQEGLCVVAPDTTVLSGPGTVLLTNDKYRSGGSKLLIIYLCSAAPDTAQVIKYQIEAT